MSKHKAINKNQLATIVSTKTNINYETSLTLIEETFNTIMDLVGTKHSVRIVGFGAFDYVEKQPRYGINPNTKERICIPESVSPTFRAGAGFKKAVKREDNYADYHANVVLGKNSQDNSEYGNF